MSVLIDGQAGVTALRKEGSPPPPWWLFSSAATISTRGVRISDTSRSWNSMALRISSLSCSSRPPSFSAWSTIVTSSSSVMPSSSRLWMIRESRRFHWVNRKLAGVSTATKRPQQGGREHGPGLRALLGQALGRDLAKDQDHHSEHDGGHRGPPHVIQQPDEQHRADGGGRVMLTMLFPMRMVDSSLS